MLSDPTSDDRVVSLFPSATLDSKLDKDVIAGYRLVTNSTNLLRVTPKATSLSHRLVGEDAVDAG